MPRLSSCVLRNAFCLLLVSLVGSAKAAEARTSVAQELVTNGSFELPALGNPGLACPASIPGWTLAFGPCIEIQNHVAGSPVVGQQFVELDSIEPCGGCGASTGIFQDLATQPGASYTLSFFFSPRPTVPETDNALIVRWNGAAIATLRANGTSLSDTAWTLHTFKVQATSTSTRLEFDDGGISNGAGTYLDGVSVVGGSSTIGAKMFLVLSDPFGLPNSGPVLRYSVDGPTGTPALDTTITDPTFDLPVSVVFTPAGEMLVINRGDGLSAGAGSITRIANPSGVPFSGGTITSPSFSGAHFGAFRQNELFVAQRGGSDVIRFLFDAAGNATFNGVITDGLCCTDPRGAAVSPTGELFVSECCGVDEIERYEFDSAGNAISNGTITGNGLNNPHKLVFSPWGELFVANGGAADVVRFTFDSSGNAAPNGQISGPTISGDVGLDFSPWGELFVANLAPPGGISRWTFDSSHTATFNGFFSTPTTVSDVQFGPSTQETPSLCRLGCVQHITIDVGFVPANTEATVDLRIDGRLVAAAVHGGGTSGPVGVEPGEYVISENGDSLRNYTGSILCTGESSASPLPHLVAVARQADVTCSITNTRQQAGSLGRPHRKPPRPGVEPELSRRQ
jgi:hypothetical protein